MIFDGLSNAKLYHCTHPALATAFEYIVGFDPSVPDARYEIDSEFIYAQVQSYTTVPAEERRWESHRRYVDVQYMVSGTERILYAPVGSLTGPTPYDEEKDVIFYEDGTEEATPLHLKAGQFAIFFPTDGHKPGTVAYEGEPVRKIVVKIRL